MGREVAQPRYCKADCAVGFVNRTDRFHPRGMLGHPAAIDQTSGAIVPGPGVNLVEFDHDTSRYFWLAIIIRTTTKIAAP